MATTQVGTLEDIQTRPLRRYADASVISPGRISWGAVIAGSAFGMAFQIWLAMLGVAIGASTVDPLKEANPFAGLGVGSAVWAGVSIIISSFIGGWIAGRMAGWRQRTESGLHGALAWAVSNLVALAVIGSVIGGVASGVTHLATGAGQTAVNAASTVGVNNSGAVQDTASGIVNTVRDEANNIVGNNGQPTAQAQADARRAGDVGAKAVAGTSFGLVLLMFLGLLAGVGGSVLAAPRLDATPHLNKA